MIYAPTLLNPVIIVTDDVVSVKVEFLAEPGNELEKGKVGFFCEFTRAVGMATFNGDGGIVAVFRADCPGNFIGRHTLNDRAIHVDDEMRADVVFVFEIFPILKRGRAGVGDVMYDDIFDAPKLIAGARFAMYGEIFLGDQLRHLFVCDVLCGDLVGILRRIGCLRGFCCGSV